MTTQDPSHYQTVAASQTDAVLGNPNGKAGDYLESLIITINTSATSTVSIKDGGGSAIPILPANSAIGVIQVWLTVGSKSGPWKVTTGAGVTVLAIGTFV